MITDSKTQNRLYADTDTVLFSLENKKEAVERMTDILKETPEYLQMMNHVPACKLVGARTLPPFTHP